MFISFKEKRRGTLTQIVLLPVRSEQLEGAVVTTGAWTHLVDNFERPTVDVNSREKKEEEQRELHDDEKDNE